MAYDPQAMQNAVSVVIGTTWPDVLPDNGGGGTTFINQIFRVPFESVTAADPATGTTGSFPIAIVWLRPAVEENWGLANEALAAEMTIFYAATETLDDTAVWSKVTSLHRPLFLASDADTLAGLRVLRMTGQNVDPSNEALSFFMNRDVPYTAGWVSFRTLYGESSL